MTKSHPELLLVGTSHHVAPVEVRGRVAAAIGTGEALAGAGIHECFVLATCHRVEIYAITPDAGCTSAKLRALVADAAGTDVPGAATYLETGLDAVRHLCRVACGLDSMVIGEAEIAGQIRRAAAAAREAGTSGVLMDRVLAGALRAGGRARSETRIGVGSLSAASAAVALVDRELGGLEHRSVLVIGAGQAGRQALGRLAKSRSGPRVVASRSEHHAMEAAARYGARVVRLEDLASAAAAVDAVIAAAQAPAFLLTADAYDRVTTGRPIFMIDLSAPRVIDPALSASAGVTIKTVDDLGDIVRQTAASRAREIPSVEAIAADEATRAYDLFKSRRDRHAVAARASSVAS